MKTLKIWLTMTPYLRKPTYPFLPWKNADHLDVWILEVSLEQNSRYKKHTQKKIRYQFLWCECTPIERDDNNAIKKEPRSNSGKTTWLNISLNPKSQRVSKPAPITPKKISKKLLISLSILLSVLDNNVPSWWFFR